MKPVAFDYIRPSSLDDVCQYLAQRDAEADVRLLAGGQTLVPLMAMRLARPTHLIDLNPLVELSGIREVDGAVEIGALTRQRSAEHDPVVAKRLPLLAKALPQVGHIQTRNRGTIGGSVATGDPSAEIPLVAAVLAARVRLQSLAGCREIDSAEFFEGPMMTGLRADECLSRIIFPVWPAEARLGCAFLEVAPRRGDYALVSAAVQIALDGDGTCTRAAVGVGACGPTPLRLTMLEEMLVGDHPDEALIARASRQVADLIDPDSSQQASADYRRRVAPEIVRRALSEAVAEAIG